MAKLLETRETEGQPTRLPQGVQVAYVPTFPEGETLVLQCRRESETDWVTTDVSFTDKGIKAFFSTPDLEFRFLATAVGAEAYIYGVGGLT